MKTYSCFSSKTERKQSVAEFSYIIKCLVISLVVVAVLQVRVNTITAEDAAHQWIQNSSVGKYTQQVAEGAVMLGRNVAVQANQFIAKNFGGKTEAETAQASRLNIELKRAHK